MSAELGALILVLGAILVLFVALRAPGQGEIPAGSAGFRSYRPSRQKNPLAFWLFFLLYIFFGGWMLLYGILMFFGKVPPLSIQ